MPGTAAGDGEAGELRRARLALCEATRQVIANGLEILEFQHRADVNVTPPARGTPKDSLRGPTATAQDSAQLFDLAANVWPRNVAQERCRRGVCRGNCCDPTGGEFGTPLFVIDESDFRGRCREIAAAFGNGDSVRYAARRFSAAKSRVGSMKGFRWMSQVAVNWPSL